MNGEREKTIVRTGAVGIAANLLLAAFKAFVGLTANAVSVLLDAVNNLTDALSSVITIVGAKLAGRRPDKKHPFGWGRVEYISASVVAVIILYAGVTSLVESVKKIIHPETPEHTTVGIVVIAVAVAVKIVLGLYVRAKGRAVNSDALRNSGTDALMDAIISFATLVSAAVWMIWGVSLEAWLAAVISLVIIKSGFSMLMETFSSILGERPEAELSVGIKKTICSVPGVLGAYDLVVNDYGPDRKTASVHIEVDSAMTAQDIAGLSNTVTLSVYEAYGVILTAVGVYGHDSDPGSVEIEERLKKELLAIDGVLQLHGFWLEPDGKKGKFDAVIDVGFPDRDAIYNEVVERTKAIYPDIEFMILLDTDFTD